VTKETASYFHDRILRGSVEVRTSPGIVLRLPWHFLQHPWKVTPTHSLRGTKQGELRRLKRRPFAWNRKGLRSKRRSSPCIFQVVVSLSIRSFLSITLIILYSSLLSPFAIQTTFWKVVKDPGTHRQRVRHTMPHFSISRKTICNISPKLITIYSKPN
jgi:hypothetical protein